MRKYLEYLAPIAALIAFVAWGWFYISGGCTQPICKILGVYRYEVRTIEDFIDYATGEDLYRIHNAAALSFSCDEIRDQLTSGLHENMFANALVGVGGKVKAEIDRLELLGARREGRTLHLANDVTVGTEQLQAWGDQVRQVVSGEPTDKKTNWLPEVLPRLFESVVLHAGDETIQIPLTARWGIHKC
jgi:hypothetical protein